MFRLVHKTAGTVAAWVAIAAVALNVLWPLIAQASPDAAAMQMVGCDDPGMQHSGAPGDTSSPDEPGPLTPHCAFCTLVSGGFAALVQYSPAPVLFIAVGESWSAAPDSGPLASFSGYSPAHPRAPPVVS